MEQETLYNVLSGAYGEVLETHAMWECIASLGIKPYKNGNQWCYLYGDNIQDGIVGFGETIFKAAWNFYSQIKIEEIAKCEHRDSSEIPNDLEEAAEKEYPSSTWREGKIAEHMTNLHCQKAFIAGAKWQAEKDARDMYMSDNRHFEKVYQLGRTDMRKQMMKEAVEGFVVKDITGSLAVTAKGINLDRFKLGDKVRIIVLKDN